MHITVNGIGVADWGRKNLLQRFGRCEHCGQKSTLLSYDTWQCFVLAFLPIVPLARNRVLNRCPLCRHQREVKLKKYRKTCENNIIEATAKIKGGCSDGQICELLQGLTQLDDLQAFNALAVPLQDKARGNAVVLASLARAYMHFNDYASASQIWSSLLSLDKKPEWLREQAVCHVRTGNPDQAEKLLEHVLEDKLSDHIDLILLVVNGYQASGQHDKALAILGRIDEVFQDNSHGIDSAYLRKLHKISTKHLLTSKPVGSAIVSPSIIKNHFDFAGIFALCLGPLLVLSVVFACASELVQSASEQGHRRVVHVVNGLTRSYSVSVNGKALVIKPGESCSLPLPEGKWEILSVQGAEDFTPVTVNFSTPFLMRPFQNKTIILNPDKMAVIIKQSHLYSSKEVEGEAYREEFFHGRLLHEFDDIDFPFRAAPESVELKSEAGSVWKTRVAVDPDFVWPSGNVVQYLVSLIGEPGYLDYLRRRSELEPEEAFWIRSYLAHAPPDAGIELLHSMLDRRPLLISWHRLYQDRCREFRKQHDVVGEYGKMLSKDPDNPYLKYLLGRCMDSGCPEAIALLEASEKGRSPIGYGYNALAVRALSNADFDAAVAFGEKATSVVPGNETFFGNYREALLCARDFDRLLLLTRDKIMESGDNSKLLIDEYCWLNCLGKKDEAEARLENFLKTNYAQEEDSGKAESLVNYAKLASADFLEDNEQFIHYIELIGSPYAQLWAALLKGDASGASSAVETLEDMEFDIHMLVFMLASFSEETSIAREHWQKSLKLLANHTDADPEKIASSDEILSLVHLEMEPLKKAIVLTSYAIAFPELRGDIIPMARKLNSKPDVIHPIVARALNSISPQ